VTENNQTSVQKIFTKGPTCHAVIEDLMIPFGNYSRLYIMS